jgi:VanZ family protein
MKRFFTPALLLRYGPAALMAALIPVLSLLPSRFFRHLEKPLPPIPAFDKLAHALMYAALTAACLHAVSLPQRQRLTSVLRIALATALYGLVMEVCQMKLTATRSMDPLDALANALGAFACALLFLAAARRRKPAPTD